MKKIFLLILTSVLVFASCEGFLDINTDPNSPASKDVSVDMILPGAEMQLCATYGNLLRIPAAYFAQQYAQSFGTSNYLDYSQFTMSATRSSSAYTQLTGKTLKNLQIIREKATEQEEWGTYLAATVLRAFTYQVLVDCYGETPYTEALDETNLAPKYDEGKDVYTGVLAELDEALSKVSGSETVATNFLYSGKTADAWVKFANALKLKLLMRMNDSSSKSALDALVAEGNFPTADVAWSGFFKNESGQGNPFFQEEFASYFGSTQTNCILNVALERVMKETDDARLGAFFAQASGDYHGGVSGSNFSTSESYKAAYFSRPVITFDSPVYLISVSEIQFFLSEYYAENGKATEAADAYVAAVEASFATAGVEGAADVLAAMPWNASKVDEVIGIQKWVALSGINNFEAWCEMRRLKFPKMGATKGTDITDEKSELNPSALPAGELYTPIKFEADLGAGKVLQRWPYSNSSSSRNANTPTFKGYATPIFWAE